MNRAQPRVSVVLPFFNAEGTLHRALESVESQDFGDFECLMVDNNSTDGSRAIAHDWSERDARFILLEEGRQGVMFASNHGSERARGKYIARMDADDVALPGRLELSYSFLENNPAFGAVAGRVIHVGDPVETAGFQRFVDWSNSVLSYKEILNSRFIEAPIVNPTAMWRRETQEQFGLYRSGDFPEDYEMWLRWLDRGVRIEKLPDYFLEWHDSSQRLTRNDPIYSDQAFFEIKSSYLAAYLEKHNPFHPEVWVWGASRISRRRARYLESNGIHISAYVDTKSTRQLDRRLIYYKELPEAGEAFILSYIRQMDNRDRIRRYLESRGYAEGVDYLLVS